MITKLLGLPLLASEHGAQVDSFIFYVHVLMGLLFVGWMSYFIYVLFRFRKSNNPTASYSGVKSHASSYIEFAVILAEAVLLIGFAVPLWAKVVEKAPTDDGSATVIRITAEQFSWSARYPGKDGKFGQQDVRFITLENPLGYDPNDANGKDDVTGDANVVYAPVNKPVIVYLTSKDVIHSFKVSPFRVTQDAIPGLIIPTWFKPVREGEYLINCAQLCGNGHFSMRGFFRVVSQDKFDQWMAEKGAKAGAAPASFE